MKRLMLFIEPTAAQINIFSQFTLPRLGSFILAGLANRRPGWNARVFVEGRARFDLTAWIARHGRPDVVGILDHYRRRSSAGTNWPTNAAPRESRSCWAGRMSPSCPRRRWRMRGWSCAEKAKAP